MTILTIFDKLATNSLNIQEIELHIVNTCLNLFYTTGAMTVKTHFEPKISFSIFPKKKSLRIGIIDILHIDLFPFSNQSNSSEIWEKFWNSRVYLRTCLNAFKAFCAGPYFRISLCVPSLEFSIILKRSGNFISNFDPDVSFNLLVDFASKKNIKHVYLRQLWEGMSPRPRRTESNYPKVWRNKTTQEKS